ncbi:hypothetical protein H0H92_015168 [Tricholoma furcatifolium]|nr:hypothetical protein H0H92_015168 [Tricholoma furcatifolium]
MARQRPYPRLSLDSTPLRHVPYDPMTPTSTPSPYARHFDPPRAPSPALSTVSALTSASASAPDLPGPPARPKQKKQRLDNNDRKRICKFHDEHPNSRQEDIANEFGVERSTISKILKQKSKWLNTPDNVADRVAKHRPSKFPEIEDELTKWLEECAAKKIPTSDGAIRDKAKEVARALGISDDRFKASSGWVENFKSRQKLRAARWPVGIPGNNNTSSSGSSSNARLIDADPSSVLSPLNPSYRPELDSIPPERDDDMHADPETNLGISASAQGWSTHAQAQPSPLSAHSHGSGSSSSAHSMGGAAPSPMATQLDPHPHPHLSMPPLTTTLPVPVRVTQPRAPTPDYHSEYFNPAQQRIPTIAEAEDHIDALMLFLDVRAREGLITREEREALQSVKIALFQEGHQINPFTRD